MSTITNVIGRKGPMESRLIGTLEGGPELERKLKLLVQIAQTDAAKDAVRLGLEVIKEEARILAPVGPEPVHIRDALAVKVGKSKKGAGGTVGVRKVDGVADEDQPALYGPRLEFGDSTRSPEPFMRPAFDARKGQAVDAVQARLAQAVMEAAR